MVNSDLNNKSPESIKVLDIFKNSEYEVPIYQRNYAWGKDEIEQLIKDIYESKFNSDNQSYYLGNLIVNRIETDTYEVIDGQQRLTTLFLLLSYLNLVTKNSLRFEAREKSNRTLNAIRNIKDKEEEEFTSDVLYSNEIVKGYSYIKNYFESGYKEDINSKNKNSSEFKNEFISKLDKIVILRTKVPEKIDLNHYFEIMNTRGEQLLPHEIIKAKIISAIKDSSNEPNSLNTDHILVSLIWDACSQMDKYVQMAFPIELRNYLFGDDWNTLNFNNFDDLRNKYNEYSSSLKKEKKTEKITSKIENELKTLEKILSDYKTNGSIFDDSLNSEYHENEKEENTRFESIISFPNFILQVNEILAISSSEKIDADSSLDDKKFFKLLENHYENKQNAENFIFNLLKYKFYFDNYIVKREYIGDNKVNGNWSLKRLVKVDKSSSKFYYRDTYSSFDSNSNKEETTENKKIKMLESCLRVTYTSPKTMHWVSNLLSSIKCQKKGYISDNDIVNNLENYCRQKVIDANYKNAKGFDIERIVFTYLDYLLWRDGYKEYNFKDFVFQYRNSIEHFFPQHPKNDAKDVDSDNLNNFGNLALLTVSANSKFSNMLPSQKVEERGNIIEQSPKLQIMKDIVVNSRKCWTNNEVKNHGDEMIALLENEMQKFQNEINNPK